MPLRVLYVDMNSFFASVEQHVRPELRGRPVVVAAVAVGSTSCIAVSLEAKKLGVHRGMLVREARKYKGVVAVEARPPLYVRVHESIVAAVETCLPVQSIDSIDEISCRLAANYREPAKAVELAHSVKRAIRDRVGASLKCSIGLAPNKFLAKVACGMQKPDGLTVIEDHNLPQVLYRLALDDLPGIGRRILLRLQGSGITRIEQLCHLTEPQMKRLWGGIVGQRWWHWLRGQDLPEFLTVRSSVGHSHVLAPELRTEEGARQVLVRLIHKAAARLRRINYWAQRMAVYVSFSFREEGWNGSVGLGLCQDTLTMIEAFHKLWRLRLPHPRPTKVALTLYDLVPNYSASRPLFAAEQRRLTLSRTMDELNQRLGVNKVYFGGIHQVRDTAPTRIAFSHIPNFMDG